MSVQYHLYANDGAGGPVDYGTVIGTVSGTTWDTPALLPGSDTTFALRAFDVGTGLEEANLDARVRIVLDGAGVDVSGLPNPPVGLSARATVSGGAKVSWQYNPGGQGGSPTGFKVYIGTPTPNYGVVAATVPYAVGRGSFSASLSGLTDGVTYQVAVRSYNATGTEANTLIATFTASSTGPAAVQGLSTSAVP